MPRGDSFWSIKLYFPGLDLVKEFIYIVIYLFINIDLCFIHPNKNLKGPCHQKLSLSMLNSHGHWSLGHWPFVPETPKKKENTFFQKFLEIVCI